MNLPDILQPFQRELTKALGAEIPLEWPKHESFIPNDQAAGIGRVLVRSIHEDLDGAKIAWLFQKEILGKLADAARAGSRLNFLSKYDFVMSFNWVEWVKLSPEHRIACVDHQLCHCGHDPEKFKWIYREHDVEEFTPVIDRWGLWQPRLPEFARSAKEALAQTELFAGAGAK
jgi:hypothetical protein